MDMTREQWARLRSIVESSGQEVALEYLRKNCYVQGQAALDHIKMAEDAVLLEIEKKADQLD